MDSSFLIPALAGFLQAAVVLAPVGDEVQVRMSGERRIREAFSPNDRVAQMVLPATGMAPAFSVSVKGRSPGVNPVVLTDDKGRSQVFLVVVPKPKL